MTNADILIRGGLVLTAGNDAPQRRDIAVKDGLISALLPPGAPASATVTLGAEDCVVTPGLVNAHTHSPEMLARGRAERARFPEWMGAVWADLDRLEPKRSRRSVLLCAAEMIRSGVTGVLDHLRRFPMTAETLEAVATAYAGTGLETAIAVMVRDTVDPSGRAIDAAHLAALPSAMAQVALVASARSPAGHVRIGLGPSAPHRCSDALLEAVAAAGTFIHTHLDETAGIAAAARERFGESSVAAMHRRGLLGPQTALAHCVAVDAADRELIADADAVVVHNPVANLRLGSGTADVPALLAAGVTVALGTDGAASNDGQNLWESLKMAALLPRTPERASSDWPAAATVFTMATRSGQRALGAGRNAGTLDVGAAADIAVFDEPDGTVETLLPRLVLGSTARRARHTIAGGRILLRDGRLTTINEAALVAGRHPERAA